MMIQTSFHRNITIISFRNTCLAKVGGGGGGGTLNNPNRYHTKIEQNRIGDKNKIICRISIHELQSIDFGW